MAGEATAESISELIDRWKQDAAEWRERMRKKIRVIMQNERGPDDFDHTDDDIRRLCGILERMLQRPSGNHYHNGGGFPKGITAALWMLVVTGICGIIVMYGRMSAIEANQVSMQRQIDAGQISMQRQIDANTAALNSLLRRP